MPEPLESCRARSLTVGAQRPQKVCFRLSQVRFARAKVIERGISGGTVDAKLRLKLGCRLELTQRAHSDLKVVSHRLSAQVPLKEFNLGARNLNQLSLAG